MHNDFWDAGDYAVHAGYVSRLKEQVFEDLAPGSGETILDLGCGDGELAAQLIDLGCTVIGIDSSQSLVNAACLRGVDARVADAQKIDFKDTFDAVFSNAALHWMPHQKELSSRVMQALKPGGRFVVEMGGHGNIAKVRAAMAIALGEIGKDLDTRNPWYFPTPEAHRAILEDAGFEVKKILLRDRPTQLPTNVAGWFVTFTREILADLTEDERTVVIKRMVKLSEAELRDKDGHWRVDYVRLNFVAIKPLPV
jgi:trans-aconitate methyltransferase